MPPARGARCVRAVRAARPPGSIGYRTRHPVGEEGSATVTACLSLAGLIVMTVLVVQFGGLVVARHRAQAAADLAALAAAGELWNGAEAGCAAAESLGRRMAAHLARCEIDGWDAVITVEEKVPLGPFGTRSIRAVARAGPVGEAT
ncbi:Rv3654c family TadE-like protein [Nocardia rhamnosiphila]|uniref:Rv3654c family TadE-like protein n=1 Tax=Nocardia rhamnosiphila TaxID=426716 RepID=UPI0027E2B4D1|nr:Rv3654c family TadE-like protein [Nocardia zapadnayensis]